MTDIYKKIKKIDISKWIVTKYYHYTSIVRDIFGEYDTAWHSKPWGDEYIKELFEHFMQIVEVYAILYNKENNRFPSQMRDNKVVIEITNIESGEKLYLGYKDLRYMIGKDVWSEFGYHTPFGVVNIHTNE